MKHILLSSLSFFVFSFLFLAQPETIHAQAGTFTCEYGTIDPDSCIVSTGSRCINYPPAGSSEQAYCAQFAGNEAGCEAGNGYCSTCDAPNQCFTGSCPTAGYTTASGRCANPQQVCCRGTNVTPPPPTRCFKCVIEGFGGNYCALTPVGAGGTCAPYWDDQVTCENACDSAGFTQITCDRSGAPQCIPASTGEFTGANAYTDCLTACTTTVAPMLCTDRMSVKTAIGCVPVLSGLLEFNNFTLLWGLGIAGGIAFLLIFTSGFMIMTSRGIPEKAASGKELLGATLSGLLFLIFATFLLRVIGHDVLHIF